MEWSLHCIKIIKPLDMSTGFTTPSNTQHRKAGIRRHLLCKTKRLLAYPLSFNIRRIVETGKPGAEGQRGNCRGMHKNKRWKAGCQCASMRLRSPKNIIQPAGKVIKSYKITIQRSAGKVNMTAIQRPAFCSIRLPWPSQISTRMTRKPNDLSCEGHCSNYSR